MAFLVAASRQSAADFPSSASACALPLPRQPHTCGSGSQSEAIDRKEREAGLYTNHGISKRLSIVGEYPRRFIRVGNTLTYTPFPR